MRLIAPVARHDGQFQRSVHGSRHDAGAVTHPDRWRVQDATKTVVVARSR
jgi:hypothetical protein